MLFLFFYSQTLFFIYCKFRQLFLNLKLFLEYKQKMFYQGQKKVTFLQKKAFLSYHKLINNSSKKLIMADQTFKLFTLKQISEKLNFGVQKFLFFQLLIQQLQLVLYNFQLMNQILKQILAIKDWENIYDFYSRKNFLNSVSPKIINQQNFENFQNFIESIVEKGPRKSKKRWVSNQRRILHVLLNCLSVINNQMVQEFKNEDIQRIYRVFPYKDKYSIEYELKKLVTTNKQNRRRWSEKQEFFLEDIVKKTQNKNKWNEIARQLFIFSKGEYFRQGKHCRQRFYKLKSDKGQQYLSVSISGSLQRESSSNQQFQSRNNLKTSKKKDIQQEDIQNMKLVNINKFHVKKQANYNQKNILSSFDHNFEEQPTQKINKRKKSDSNKEKTTRQSIEQQKQGLQCSMKDRMNTKIKKDEVENEKIKQADKIIEQKKQQIIQGQQNKQNYEQKYQHLVGQMPYSSMIINYPTSQYQTPNGMMNPIYYNQFSIWSMSHLSIYFPGFNMM